MKYRITKIGIPLPGDDLIIRYVVEIKNHWWNKWKYVMDGNYPQLFEGKAIITLWYEFIFTKNAKFR